jgi:serine/threonine-protein kinase
VLLLGGAIAAAIALSGDDSPPPAQKVAVPALVGQQQAEAEQALQAAGLEVGEVSNREVTDEAQVGIVLETNPASGAQVDEGSKVALVVGVAPDTVTVPNVVGLDVERATTTLEDAGFRVSTREVDSLEDEGTVVAVDPEEGSAVPPDTAVTLSVSSGSIELPDVTGQTEQAARDALVAAGFSAGQIRTEEADADGAAPGTVVGTDPGAGADVSAGDVITLQVAAAAQTITVPDVTGQLEAQARATLANAGFTNVTRQGGADGDVPGTAAGTDPPAGSQADPDEEILLLIVG